MQNTESKATKKRLVFEPDPTGHFAKQGVTPQQISEAMGFIPDFVVNAIVFEQGLREGVIEAYGFPAPKFDGAVVDKETGMYQYPEDPVQYPMCRINHPNGDIAYMYQHAMMSFFDEGSDEPYNTRMD